MTGTITLADSLVGNVATADSLVGNVATAEAEVIPVAAYDWYVNSVTGNDANDGKYTSSAFKTIAKLLTVMGVGDSVALAKGSTWRETYSAPGIGCTAVAYGSGAAPILDCRDVVANASFTKTVGQTNVYQITVSPDLAVSGTWNSVWQDGARLVRATSIANCDATAGSYYPSSDTVAPITMYVHASDSSSLITNGKVYLYSQRQYSVESYAYTGVGINGIVGIGNLGESGSFRIGKSSILYGCQALEGNKHNVYTRTGCWIENMTASLSYYGTGTMGLFAYNEDTPNSEGITYLNCIANMGGVLNSLQTGFMGHNNVSGVFGSITYTGCTVADCLAAFGGQHATFTLTNCTVSNCVSGLAAYANTTISGGTWTTISAVGRLVSCLVTGLTISATGLTGSHQEHGFFNSGATCTFVLTNCTLTCSGNGANVWMQGATSNNLTSNGNHFTHGGGGYTPYWFNNANYTFTGDNNNYKAAGTMYAAGFLTFAQWQAAVAPQDANSTVG